MSKSQYWYGGHTFNNLNLHYLKMVHSYLTTCSIEVLEKTFTHFLYISMLNFKPTPKAAVLFLGVTVSTNKNTRDYNTTKVNANGIVFG